MKPGWLNGHEKVGALAALVIAAALVFAGIRHDPSWIMAALGLLQTGLAGQWIARARRARQTIERQLQLLARRENRWQV